MANLEFRKLKTFSIQIRADVSRDLALLREIETTLDALDFQCAQFRQLNRDADSFIQRLSANYVALNNSDVDLVALFESARDELAKKYDQWSDQHLCAIEAPELSDEDGVVEAWALLLTEVAALHDKLNTLAWLIREQEAEQDLKIPGAFANADDLFEALGV